MQLLLYEIVWFEKHHFFGQAKINAIS
jgi:hypothetical protein